MSINWVGVFIVVWAIAMAVVIALMPARCNPSKCPPVTYSSLSRSLNLHVRQQ